VLPADDAPPTPGGVFESVTDNALTAATERVAAYATGAWAVATDGDDLLEAELGFGPDEHTVVARARVHGRSASSPMAVLELSLLNAGWRTARPPAGVEVLVAHRGAIHLRATYAPTGALTLAVESAPYAVGIERARVLVGA
jgi:hypothetical protein